MRFPLRMPILLAVLTLALQGCGGSLAVRGSFAGPPAPPAAAGGAHHGLHAKGGGALAVVLVLGLIVADAIDSATPAPAEDGQPQQARRSLWQPIDRGWVDRGP